MSNDHPEFDELDRLLALADEEELSVEQRDRLNQILRESVTAVEYASDKLVTEALLRNELLSDATGDLLGMPQSFLPPEGAENLVSPRFGKRRALLAVAAAVVFASLLGFLLQKKSSPVQVADSAKPATQALARMINQLDTRFAPNLAPEGDEFEVGRYELQEGIAELEFRTGAKFVVEGPADFTIKNDMHVFLTEGRIRARISDRATGFRIDAPEVDVVDLGTEFGIAVNPDQKTEVHVFSGEVELHEEGSKEARLVREGYAAGWEEGSAAVVLTQPREEEFRTAKDISQTLGRQLTDRLLADGEMVAFYDFQPDESSSGRLVNRANPQAVNGRIHGATWVRGRQPNSSALLFENVGDRVFLEIDGEFPEFTLSTWLKVERFDSYITAIFNTDNYERHEHHWQLLDDGAVQGSQLGKNPSLNSPEIYRIKSEEDTVPIGRWTHLAATFSISSGDVRYYVDGRLVAETVIDPDCPVRFGKCNIGHWGSPAGPSWPKQRNFCGRIDEFFLLRRAMSSEEIAEIHQLGRPAKW
ncbi:LamG-like jellyroll fold domain-containing protein [Roseibacillus persicicus]|uniref:FecR protein domain-containing protein n=1 Tax=Roseibacillus persicicus TaxID=454148 RepID=A0A918TMK5_9BACT|nr:LamG-like jellyroll fold domain-containing protein [Roseibacillus persicicus]GHC54595.1 hypothetical protein GCM10007100_21300 [Roseibacillus persicicus]